MLVVTPTGLFCVGLVSAMLTPLERLEMFWLDPCSATLSSQSGRYDPNVPVGLKGWIGWAGSEPIRTQRSPAFEELVLLHCWDLSGPPRQVFIRIIYVVSIEHDCRHFGGRYHRKNHSAIKKPLAVAYVLEMNHNKMSESYT